MTDKNDIYVNSYFTGDHPEMVTAWVKASINQIAGTVGPDLTYYLDTCSECGIDVECGVDIDGLCCACDGGGEVCSARVARGTLDEATLKQSTFSSAGAPTGVTINSGETFVKDTRPLAERLPSLSEKRFWRITKQNALGWYEIHLREKRLIGSKKIVEGFIPQDEMNDDKIVSVAKWCVQKAQHEAAAALKTEMERAENNGKAPKVGDYTPKRKE